MNLVDVVQQSEINPVTQAVQRCLAAYHHVLETNPKPAKSDPAHATFDVCRVEKLARKAFIQSMPFLDTWEHVLGALACLQHAIVLDIFDRVDAGRHIHLIQLAISAHRPKAEPRDAGRPRHEKYTPLPPITRQDQPFEGAYISPNPPREERQFELAKELKDRGVPIPTPQEAVDAPGLIPLLFALAEVYKTLPRRQPPATAPKAQETGAPGTESRPKAAA